MLSAYCTVLQLFLTLHGIWTDILQVLSIYKVLLLPFFAKNRYIRNKFIKWGCCVCDYGYKNSLPAWPDSLLPKMESCELIDKL